MAINISNILTQLNTKMTSDSSANTTELLRRVQLYQSLNNIGVLEYQYYDDLPTVDSSNIGQLAYVRASTDDSFGTFFFSKAFVNDSGTYDALDSTNSGWQKIVLNANDSDNFSDITSASGGAAGEFYQGSTYGYAAGLIWRYTPTTYPSKIFKFPFAAEDGGTEVGDLISSQGVRKAGSSSTTHGYTAGGMIQSPAGPYTSTNVIEKFSFSVDGNSTDVGDLRFYTGANANLAGGAGQTGETHGYHSGGANTGPVQPYTPPQNYIQKYPFSADANATDVGDLTSSRHTASGQNSTENGYTSGGSNAQNTSYGLPASYVNVIDKFPFSTDANATDVGNLTTPTMYVGGSSSSTHGYTHGGYAPGSPLTANAQIDKFSFTSDANATDVGNLAANQHQTGGASTASHGYLVGGYRSGSIQKYSFASDGDATGITSLGKNFFGPSGHQV